MLASECRSEEMQQPQSRAWETYSAVRRIGTSSGALAYRKGARGAGGDHRTLERRRVAGDRRDLLQPNGRAFCRPEDLLVSEQIRLRRG